MPKLRRATGANRPTYGSENKEKVKRVMTNRQTGALARAMRHPDDSCRSIRSPVATAGVWRMGVRTSAHTTNR